MRLTKGLHPFSKLACRQTERFRAQKVCKDAPAAAAPAGLFSWLMRLPNRVRARTNPDGLFFITQRSGKYLTQISMSAFSLQTSRTIATTLPEFRLV